MMTENPYDLINETVGIQARYLFDGDNAHPNSLQLIGLRGLQHRIANNSIKRLRAQAPGQPLLLVWESLPHTWRELVIQKYGTPPQVVKKSLFEKEYERDWVAFDYYSKTFKFSDASTLDDDKVAEYTLNASVLNTINKVNTMRRTYRKVLKGNNKNVWESICEESTRFKKVRAHTLPDNPQSLRRVLNAYLKDGYPSLISGRHKNRNARKVTPETETFLNCLFAEYAHKPTKYDVARQYEGFLNGYIEVINNTTGEIYTPSDFPRLSVATITNYLSKWKNSIATETIRGGDRQKLMAKFKPYHSLIPPQYAGSIISVDDRQPAFEYAKGKRAWFYNAIDLGSEAFVCWVWGKTKEGIILDFYRQLVRNYAEWGINMPAELEGEMSLNSSFLETFLQEGNMFQYVRIEANNARGKRIEQYYSPLRYKYEKKREGWLARPSALSEANQAGPKKVLPVPYNEIITGCLQDIETWNNTEHSRIKGKTRWEVFMEMQNPNVRLTNYRGIIPFLGYATKSSCHAGIINFRKNEFLLGDNGTLAVGDTLINFLDKVEGRDVELRWLDDNNGDILKAYIYAGGTFICEAVPKPGYQKARIEQTPEDIINRQLMSMYVSTIESYKKGKIREIDQLTVIDNTPKTLNTKFQIAALHRRQQRDIAPEELPDLNAVQTPFNIPLNDESPRSLKDRY